MDSQLLDLYAEVVDLKARLACAVKEKEAAEQSLLHVVKLFSRLPLSPTFSGTTEAPSTTEAATQCSFTTDMAPAGTIVTPDTESLLDTPPELDIGLRGTRTHHDEDLETLAPLSAPKKTFKDDTCVFKFGWTGEELHGPTPLFLIYGIRYQPPCDLRRTFHQVLLTGIPPGADAFSLLHKVRGGMVVSCQILDTVQITDSMSALIRFKDETDALGFVNWTAQHTLKLGARRITTGLIRTPTYPLPEKLHHDIFFKYHTRCLKVEGLRTNPMHYLQKQFLTKVVVEYASLSAESGEALTVHFTSVQQASRAHDYLRSIPKLLSAKISFLDDPCAQPFPVSNI